MDDLSKINVGLALNRKEIMPMVAMKTSIKQEGSRNHQINKVIKAHIETSIDDMSSYE